jgi:hypothetical protein
MSALPVRSRSLLNKNCIDPKTGKWICGPLPTVQHSTKIGVRSRALMGVTEDMTQKEPPKPPNPPKILNIRGGAGGSSATGGFDFNDMYGFDKDGDFDYRPPPINIPPPKRWFNFEDTEGYDTYGEFNFTKFNFAKPTPTGKAKPLFNFEDAEGFDIDGEFNLPKSDFAKPTPTGFKAKPLFNFEDAEGFDIDGEFNLTKPTPKKEGLLDRAHNENKVSYDYPKGRPADEKNKAPMVGDRNLLFGDDFIIYKKFAHGILPEVTLDDIPSSSSNVYVPQRAIHAAMRAINSEESEDTIDDSTNDMYDQSTINEDSLSSAFERMSTSDDTAFSASTDRMSTS